MAGTQPFSVEAQKAAVRALLASGASREQISKDRKLRDGLKAVEAEEQRAPAPRRSGSAQAVVVRRPRGLS